MTTGTSGKQALIKELTAALTSEGFKKVSRPAIFADPDLAEGVEGWLTLGFATKHTPRGIADVAPHVGVRYQAIERELLQLRGGPSGVPATATYSMALGHTMPQKTYLQWTVSSDNAVAVAREIVAAVKEYGVPFMLTLSELPRLVETLRRNQSSEQDYRLPIALHLLGRHKEAAEVVEESERRLGDRKDPAADIYRRFAQAFHALVVSSSAR